MKFILALCLLLILTAGGLAQSTQADLETRLLHKPLYLRGLWVDDDLQFDSQGKNLGSPAPTSFTLGGVEIDSVKLNPASLVLKGHRVGLEFKDNVPHRVALKAANPSGVGRHDAKISLTVAAPDGGNFDPALTAIFTDKLAELIPNMPWEWQWFASQEILHEPAQPVSARDIAKDLRKIGNGVTSPVVLRAPEPQFSEAARLLAYSGRVLVYLQVNKAGQPQHVRILKPAGLGLDEHAVEAVKAYQFKPATEDGQPVAVELNVMVDFKVN